MFIVTKDTLLNPGALDTKGLPKRFLSRVMPWPRARVGWPVIARLVFEMQMLRYTASLIPFVVAMLIWPRAALPLAQAPLAMIIVIALVEGKLLSYSDKAAEALLSDADADRIEDLLRFRAQGCLARIAARRGLDQGALQLVVEQSEMARVRPLTLITVQSDQPKPHVLDLDEGDCAVLRTGLFTDDLTEDALHRLNARSRTYLRSIAFDTGAVSAHARLTAALERRAAAEATA